MADEAVGNGNADGEITQQKGLPLETIDLNSKPSPGGQHQSLQEFQQELPSNTQGATAADPPRTVSPIEGTELQGRPRSRSSGINIKDWTHQLKITKQLVQERFGHGVRTVDTNLDKRIEDLKDTQKKYSQMISLSNQFCHNFVGVIETQKSMSEHFAFMSIRAPELTTQFHYNSETQKIISRNGERLLAAVKYFVSNLQTVSTKTIGDTLQTVKVYESARLAYDAYRTETENVRRQAATSQKAMNNLEAVNAEYEKHKKKFEQLRKDVDIKLKLLDENKLKVIHKQLVLLQEAFVAYFSCNHEALDALLVEFKGKIEAIEEATDSPAWLEDLPSDPPRK